MNRRERGPRRTRLWVALGGVLLSLCGPVPAARAQSGSAEAARVYAYCRARADAAFQNERHIDQDIIATLGDNWRRAGTLPLERSQMFAEAAGRAYAVLAGCMRAYGFARAG
jgi:hypothetical protein